MPSKQIQSKYINKVKRKKIDVLIMIFFIILKLKINKWGIFNIHEQTNCNN